MSKQVFASGPVMATLGAAALKIDLAAYVQRHLAGDFGMCGRYAEIELSADEAQPGALATAKEDYVNIFNVYAIRHGGRVLSAYDTPAGKLWIVTDGIEAGGKAGADTFTTCMLPDEY